MEAELRARGHRTVAPDLPCDDDTAGLPEYANTVVTAVEKTARTGALVIAGQSLGGFVVPLVADRAQSEVRLSEPSPLRAWPDVPTRVLLCRDDRLLPPAFVRRVARERLGVVPDEIPGGHTPALSRPRELAERLEAYAVEG